MIREQAESDEHSTLGKVLKDTPSPCVRCGDEQLGKELSRLLSQRVSSQQIRLLLDIPRGWLATLETPTLNQTLIITDNPCPEYQLDLLEHHPAGMVLSLELNCILRALASLQKGETFLPTVRSSLTRAERSVLYLSAIGRSAKDMAKERDTSVGTVNNVLHVIYQKLGLGSRVELAHYYFGNWHLLEGHVTHLNSKLGVKNRTQLAFYYWGMKYEYLAKIEPAILARLHAAKPGKTPNCTQGKPSGNTRDFPVFKSPYSK